MLRMLRKPKSRDDTGIVSGETRSIAKERLQNALNRDHYDLLAPNVMDDLKRDLLAAISRNLEVGEDFHELEIRRLDQSLYLVASIRIEGMPRWATVG